MKKFLMVLFVLGSSLLFSQEAQDEEKTFFGSSELKSGGYGGPEIRLTKMMDDMSILVGARGGWIVNSTFSIGLGGYGLVTSHEVYRKQISGMSDSVYYLRMGYGGLFLEYINNSNDLIHLTLSALIGAGGAANTLSMNNWYDEYMNFDNNRWTDDRSAFFIFEPGANVELNMAKFLRIDMGISYRFVSGLELEGVTNSDLSGLSANLIFKFGKF